MTSTTSFKLPGNLPLESLDIYRFPGSLPSGSYLRAQLHVLRPPLRCAPQAVQLCIHPHTGPVLVLEEVNGDLEQKLQALEDNYEKLLLK